MSSKRNILLVLLNAQFARSWIQTPNLQELRTHFHVDLATNASATPILQELGEATTDLPIPPPNLALRYSAAFARTSTLATRETYLFNMRRHFFGHLVLTRQTLETRRMYLLRVLKAIVGGMKRIASNAAAVVPLFVPIRANRLLATWLAKLGWRAWSSQEMDSKFRQYDAVIIATNAMEYELPALLMAVRQSGALSVVAPDNWDNLSTKAAFVVSPDKILVMGESAIAPVIKRHGLNSAQIWVTGLPKFNYINSLGNPKKGAQIGSLRIGYLGYSQSQREKEFLNQVAKMIFDELRLNAEIEYRTHPFRITMPVWEPELDSRIQEHTHSREERKKYGNYPSLDPRDGYYDRLLKFDLVIAGPTTLALETIMLGIPTMIDMRRQPDLFSSPMNSLAAYPHFRELLQTPNLPVFFTADAGLTLLKDWISSKGKVRFPDIEYLVERRPFIELLTAALTRELDGNVRF